MWKFATEDSFSAFAGSIKHETFKFRGVKINEPETLLMRELASNGY